MKIYKATKVAHNQKGFFTTREAASDWLKGAQGPCRVEEIEAPERVQPCMFCLDLPCACKLPCGDCAINPCVCAKAVASETR